MHSQPEVGGWSRDQRCRVTSSAQNITERGASRGKANYVFDSSAASAFPHIHVIQPMHVLASEGHRSAARNLAPSPGSSAIATPRCHVQIVAPSGSSSQLPHVVSFGSCGSAQTAKTPMNQRDPRLSQRREGCRTCLARCPQSLLQVRLPATPCLHQQTHRETI